MSSFAADKGAEFKAISVAFLPSAIALAWFVSRASAFWIHRPDLRAGWLVLGLFLYLVWEAWQSHPCPVLRWSWMGLGLLGVGVCGATEAQVYRMAFGETTVSMFLLGTSLLLVMAGNVGYVFGSGGIRLFAFALAFLALSLPMPDTLYYPVVSGLQEKVAVGTVNLLNLVGVPAHQTGSVINLPHGRVGIDEACSGVRSLQSTVMATLFIGYLTLRRNSFRVLLVAIGVLFALVGNLTRAFSLSLIAGIQGAGGVHLVHDPAGWAILAFSAAAVAGVAHGLAGLERRLVSGQ